MPVIVVRLGDNIIQTFELGTEPARIGRARDNDIVVENLSVSRNHAFIEFADSKYFLVDNKSSNGVFINGVKVNKAEIVDGDVISIGKHQLHYSEEDASSIRNQQKVESIETLDLEPIQSEEGFTVLPYLEVTRGKLMGLVYPIKKNKSTIGRSHQNDVRLNDWEVSRLHASITYENGQFLLRDLGSWRGTTINAESIKEKAIKAGDEILMGDTVLKFAFANPDDVIEDSKLFSFASGNQTNKSNELLDLPISIIKADQMNSSSGQNPAFVDDETEEFADDDFEPMTSEELEALELDADLAYDEHASEHGAGSEFADLQAERNGSLLDNEDTQTRKNDESHFDRPETGDLIDDEQLAGDDDIHLEDAEEEKALFGGPVENVNPSTFESSGATPPPVKPAAKETPKKSVTSSSSSSVRRPATGLGPTPVPDSVDDIYIPEGVDPVQVKRWGHGLRNRSEIIRREAARKLKELTGINYDWESGPEK